jgi:phosphate-selective porin OprO/OprP
MHLVTLAALAVATAGSPARAGADGFTVEDESGAYRLQLRAYAHFDGRFFLADDAGAATDTFLLRRVRPILQGSLGRYFEFSITPDFGGGTAGIQDAYLDFKPSARLRVRAGKFKSPVGLERLQSSPALHLVERALPTGLLPTRDLGVQVLGDGAGGVIAYQAAVLDGAPDGGSVDGDLNDAKDVAGRLILSPFKKTGSLLRDLGFGISGVRGRSEGTLPTYRSPGQVPVVTAATGVTADGTRRRYSPQLLFYAGPFGLMAEYARSSSDVRKDDGGRLKFEAAAWQTTVIVSLTGDAVSYAGPRPRHSFEPSSGRWGGLELVARVHAFELDRGSVDGGLVDPARSVRRILAWAVGFNWLLSRNVKQVVTFEHSSFRGGAAGGGNRPSENVVFIRTQLSF